MESCDVALKGWRSSVAILSEIDTKLKVVEDDNFPMYSPDYCVVLIANMNAVVVA